MLSRRLRLAVAGAAVPVAVLCTSACTTHAGAAAQVGSGRISVSDLRGLVSRGLSAGSTKEATAARSGSSLQRDEVQRRQLTFLISTELLKRLAGRLNVEVTPQDVDAYRQAFAALQYGGEPGLRSAAAAGGIAPADLPRYMEEGALELAVQDKAAGNNKATDSQITSAYDQVKQQFPNQPLSLAAARPWLAKFLVSQQRTAVVRSRLTAQARSDGVSVNPRFGRWDGTQLTVAAADGSVATRQAPGPASPTTSALSS
jgi:hypothetical protein